LVGHLEELRNRFLKAFGTLFVFWCVGWIYETPVRTFLTNRAERAIAPQLPAGSVYKEMIVNAPDAFMIKLKVSFFLALLFAFPFIVLQIWAFIAPGLKPNEQRPFRRLGPISLILFGTGAAFCWFVIPSAYSWFASYMDSFPGADLMQEAGTMAMFTLKCLIAFGIGFQLPLVVYILGALNLLSAETLVKYWRHGAVAIFFLAGAITPSNDPATMLMMAVPLTLLFLVSAYAVKVTQRKKKPDQFLWAPEESETPEDVNDQSEHA
jgi:sec-independent protein translocase protein TatC